MALGCDTATKLTSERIQALVSQKYTFVARYLSGSYSMSLDEVKNISKASLFIVSIWEKGRPTDSSYFTAVSIWEKGRPTDSSYFTAAQGTSDGQSAILAAKAIGQPAGTPIYFAVDYDASASDISGPIRIYLQAIKKVFEADHYYYALGLYGSGSVLKYFKNTFSYTWLAGASGWSGSKDYADWSIKQYDNNTPVGTFTIDKDNSNGHAGGWKL